VERAENQVEWSGAMSGRAKNDGVGAACINGGRRDGTERGAAVTEIDFSVERVFRRSPSNHLLCSSVCDRGASVIVSS